MARSPLFVRKQPGGIYHVDNTALTVGNIWYVNSVAGGAGTTSSYGYSPDAPFSTVAAALDSGNLAAGDIVYVASGHTETLSAAAGWDVDTAGITIVGMGNGSKKPTITLGTATTTDIDIDADNVTIRGFRFVGDIDDLATFIDCNSNYFTIEDCEFVTSSTKEALCFIDMATTKDYLTVKRCRFEQPTDPGGLDGGTGTGGIYLVDSEYIHVQDCWFVGNFETAAVHNKTTACKYLVLERCYIYSALSGSEPLQLVAAAIGVAKECFFATPAEVATTEATLYGTLGDGFFIAASTSAGNDGAAGGQGGIVATAAS